MRCIPFATHMSAAGGPGNAAGPQPLLLLLLFARCQLHIRRVPIKLSNRDYLLAMTPASQERRSGRVRKKAPVLEDENFVQAISSPRSHDAAGESLACSQVDCNHVPVNKKLSLVYGKERPPDAPKDACAACLKTTVSTEVVLLCDGSGCDREYHLSCSNLVCVPGEDEPFYCVDCHPVGIRSEILQKYLDQHLDERDVPESDGTWTQAGVWRQLIAKDLDHKQSNSPKSGNKSRPPLFDGMRVPRSELDSPTLWITPEATGTEQPFLVGCPVRMYVPLLNDYVAGRITDYRENHDIQEHYVRFPAGSHDMKEPVSAWVILEEHALLVNTGVVLVASENGTAMQQKMRHSPGLGEKRSFDKANLTNEKQMGPNAKRGRDEVATVWVRTSRELLWLKKLDSLPIPFYNQGESPWFCETPRSECAKTAMIKKFGTSKRFRFVEASKLTDFDPTKDRSFLDPIAFSLAMCELTEKKRVCDWYALRSQRPISHIGQLKRDIDDFPPLDVRPRIHAVSLTKGQHVKPCAMVRPGLDRAYIAQRLQKLGVHVDTFLAARVESEGGEPFYSNTSVKKH